MVDPTGIPSNPVGLRLSQDCTVPLSESDQALHQRSHQLIQDLQARVGATFKRPFRTALQGSYSHTYALTYTENYNVLELLGVMQETQMLKRTALGTVKDLIFMSLQPAFQQLDTLPLSELCSLYAAVLPFNHPHLALLAEQITNLLGGTTKEFDPLVAETLIAALRRRAFPSTADFALLKAILSRL